MSSDYLRAARGGCRRARIACWRAAILAAEASDSPSQRLARLAREWAAEAAGATSGPDWAEAASVEDAPGEYTEVRRYARLSRFYARLAGRAAARAYWYAERAGL